MTDTCDECGEVLADDDIITEQEGREFWGAPCSETVPVGYKCHHCGHVEKY